MKLVKNILILYLFFFNILFVHSKEKKYDKNDTLNREKKENIDIFINDRFIDNYKYFKIIPAGNNFYLLRDNSGKKMNIEIINKKNEGEVNK